MTVLVTGGAGFIGSHVVDRLVADGLQVRVLDDLSTGTLKNLAAVRDVIEFVQGDIADPVTVAAAVADCRGVVHLAAVASVEASVREPLRTNRTNLVGTLTVLEAAAAAGAGKVVYASSAAVYGEAARLPITETSPLHPLSPYAADKLAGEHYLAHYQRQGRLDGTAFRFFNVYGPRQDPGSPYSGVISVFLERVGNGQKVTVHGDGSQTRDFVYVGDVVEGIKRALDGQVATAGSTVGDLRVLNLGHGSSTSLLGLLDTVMTVYGRHGEVEVEHAPRRHGAIAHSLADVSALRRELGWAPSPSLAEGPELAGASRGAGR